MSVNRPTDPAQKQADINRKLQMYGIFEAFGNGKVPSNKQIDVALNSFLAHPQLAKPDPRLSAEGKSLLQDFRDVVEQAKILLLTKNEGNLLQDFIWQCQVAGTGSASSPNAPVDAKTAQQHAKQAFDGLRSLGTLIITNGQFRKLLNDVQLLARDMAGDVAQKAANRVNPDQEELDKIDEPEDDDTWHDTPDGPDVRGKKDEMKNKLKANKPFDRDGLKQAAQDAQQAGNKSGGGAAGSAMAAAKTGLSSLRGQANQNTDDDAQEKATQRKEQAKEKGRQVRDITKNYLNEKVPQERRDQTIYRLKKMIVEIQGHPDYQDAIDTLLSLAEKYQGYTKSAVGQTAGATKTAHQTDGGITAAEDDLKILIERFANYTSTDDFFDALNQFYRDADSDPELKGWFKHLDVFIRKCLKERGYVMKDSATDEWNKISDQGDYLFRERYRDHTQRVIDESKFLADQFDADPLNKRFAQSMQKLFDNLGTDENGKQTFKPHLVKDVFNVIIPNLFESIRYIPVPRIEYSDPMADAVIENLIIESDNLMPNMIEFGNDNYFRWGRKGVPIRNKNKIMGSVSGIQMDLKDISYFIHKKHGFPSVRDTGLMDIFLGGSGFSFKLAMETADPSDNRHFFKVNSVVVDIKHMNIKLKQSKYKLMFSIVKPLLLKVMTPILTKVIEKVIKDKIHQVDEFLYGIYQEAQRAAEEARKNPDPDNVKGMAQSYFDAAKNKLQEKQAAAKDKSADKTVNVAMTKDDSLFKNVNLPGGISTKATEYKHLAAQGKKWESPIFSIGTARETASLPPTRTIKRRPHETAPSQVRGTQNIGQGMNAYSKKDESEVFNEGDKYGQTGHYGGERGNTGGKAASSGNQGYGSSTSQSTSQGYGSSTAAQYSGRQGDAVYDQDAYNQSAGYGSNQYASQGAGYGADQYGTQGIGYAQDQYATGDYSSTGNAAYSQQYPAGYTPASSGYVDDTLGTATSTYDTSRTAGTTTAAASGYGSNSPTLSTGERGTTLGLSNPVLSGRI